MLRLKREVKKQTRQVYQRYLVESVEGKVVEIG